MQRIKFFVSNLVHNGSTRNMFFWNTIKLQTPNHQKVKDGYLTIGRNAQYLQIFATTVNEMLYHNR